MARSEEPVAQTNSGLTIWGAGTSRTLRPLWVAEELGLSYRHRPIGPRTGETQTAAYTALNPKQKVPCLEHGDFCLSESIPMCRYLLEISGDEHRLFRPRTALERIREDEWLAHVYGEIDETSLYVMRRHRDLAPIYGDAPAAVASSKRYAERHLDVVAAHLANRHFLVGDQFGIADVLLVSCLDWAQAYGLELRTELLTYGRRVRARPGYQRALAANEPPRAARAAPQGASATT